MPLKPNAFLHNQMLKAPGYDQQNNPVMVDVVFDQYLDQPEVIKGREGKITIDCTIIVNGQRTKASTELLISTPF